MPRLLINLSHLGKDPEMNVSILARQSSHIPLTARHKEERRNRTLNTGTNMKKQNGKETSVPSNQRRFSLISFTPSSDGSVTIRSDPYFSSPGGQFNCHGVSRKGQHSLNMDSVRMKEA